VVQKTVFSNQGEFASLWNDWIMVFGREVKKFFGLVFNQALKKSAGLSVENICRMPYSTVNTLGTK
jgi:hypothetical protein